MRRETDKKQEVQVLYGEGIASHTGPEPCVVFREGQGEASAGERAGWPLSPAPGADGLRWQDYAVDLDRRIGDLHDRVHRGAYRAQPSRRRFIPKPDGRQRPLAIAALEDKIVQRAVAMVLNAIYEGDFLGFSYGFRPDAASMMRWMPWWSGSAAPR